jgi:type I restriction enzyme S subunit
MLLRWTSKLADKRKKHVDDIACARVDAEHPFIIALNSVRLSRYTEENGISQWPFAVEATFPIGPLAVPVDRETGKMGEAYQSLRFSIAKRPGVERRAPRTPRSWVANNDRAACRSCRVQPKPA